MFETPTLKTLIGKLRRLPGIGEKTAQRLALFILEQPGRYAEELAAALCEARERIHPCPSCGIPTEAEICQVCSSPHRDLSRICIVEKPQDAAAIEATREFRGLYYVLHGLISPLKGIGPEELGLPVLLQKIAPGKVTELIIALNRSVEGEATALYLEQKLSGSGIAMTRLATGIPMGADLEYADKMTLSRAIADRRKL